MTDATQTTKRSYKKWVLLTAKVGFSVAMLYVIFQKVIAREGAGSLTERLSDLHWGWVAGAVAMQLIAIGFSVVRWQRLLKGQGIKPTWRFLGGSIMIARFWGAFTPGGFTGFGGWRIYDIARHTGKTARATATIGIEMILGQLAFGALVMASSIFGFELIGTEGVILVNAGFAAVIAVGLTVLARPGILRWAAGVLPANIRPRLRTLVDAVCAYQGKTGLLVQAGLCGIGTHAFNNLIYVCTAQALGVELSVSIVFFGSSLQILSTIIPASINGIGLREATAVALYTTVGVAAADAVLIPMVGFAAEMVVSSVGGLIFLLRRSGYKPVIEVEDPDREEVVHREIQEIPRQGQPQLLRATSIGLGAGLLAGVLVGLGEAAVIVGSAASEPSFRVFWYGAVAYGLLASLLGAGLGFGLAITGRWMKREAERDSVAYSRFAGLLTAVIALGLGAFRIRRDVFDEALVWKSLPGLGVLLGCAVAATLMYLVVSFSLRWLVMRKPGAVLLRSWGSPLVAAMLILLAATGTLFTGRAAGSTPTNGVTTDGARPGSGRGAGSVLFIVIDTLRADHLPDYGYERGSTPNLVRFSQDAVRFDQAFVNSSWTRPSFASLLTGRYPNNHGVMGKKDALPSEVVTMAEALSSAGYDTAGFVTNYNVSPYYNFQQGFDHYRYIEPNFPLGADDTTAKLLLYQFVRQRLERLQGPQPGAAYEDAETVNEQLFAWLNHAPSDRPWFLFVGYMDPHDPYFPHPYENGRGYARAGERNPDPELAPVFRDLYDQEITFWDEHFGALVEDLKRRGVYDELTIIVTADHGEEFNDHGGFWHGVTLYDEQVRVPLYVKLPSNRRAGTTVRHWVQSVDIMPTILGELEVDVPEGVQGGDLFEGTDRVYAWENHERNDLESLRERRGTDEYKVITANAGNPRGLPTEELFRVDLDPGELRSLDLEETEEAPSVRTALREEANRTRVGAARTVEVEVGDEQESRLRAIGYVEEH